MIILAPSMLSADFSKLGSHVEEIEKAGASYLHVDVMDGSFVNNISFGHPVIKSIRELSSLFFDVHLMVQWPEKHIESFASSGANGITFHVEATDKPLECINKVKALGLRAAISLNPTTDISSIVPFLPYVDMVLVMSVEPGKSGQKFIRDSIYKVEDLVKIKKEQNLFYDIEIDGGITLENVRDVLSAGVNVIVAGSSVFGAQSPYEAVKDFQKIFMEYKF